MNCKYLEKLEFNKIIEILKGYAITPIGKNLIKNLLPSTDKKEVEKLLCETHEASILIYRKSNPPLVPVEDITITAKSLKAKGTLSCKSLLDLGTILKTSRELKEYFSLRIADNEEPSPNLEIYFNELYTNARLEQSIFSSIIDENTIDDNASSKLKDIRRNIRKAETDIRNKLNSYMGSKYIQESVITIRSGRFVIPVKQEYRSSIDGFVHDISASGATVFIEPMSVFELNNRISSLKTDETVEIERILQSLSSLFYEYTDELEKTQQTIGILDSIFAKAKYAISQNAVKPILNDEKYICLYKARHPLIDSKKVVPIDISIGKDYTQLIITGPNTGGKTVTLKTVGLLCAMAMSGLFIPTKENSSIFVFDNIFADIGDEQSILESLSTFSAHMVNIIEIINESTSNSLVLLDEVGSRNRPSRRLKSCN